MDRFDLYEQGKWTPDAEREPEANPGRCPVYGVGKSVHRYQCQEAEKGETELALQLADRYISIQEASEGMITQSRGDMDYRELDGGGMTTRILP